MRINFRDIYFMVFSVISIVSFAEKMPFPISVFKKANKGDIAAQVSMGWFFMKNGDEDDALKWWMRAAEVGNVEACLNLGDFYMVRKDMKAKYWYEKAVELGSAKASRGLAVYYQDMEHNTEESLRWMTDAANKDDTESQFILGNWYRHDEPLIAISWYEKAIEKGDVRAMHRLADTYYQIKDYEHAFYWYKEAAEKGDIECQSHVGYMYTYGKGVDINHKKAGYWIRRAAESGYSVAQFNLGLFYSRGSIGLEKDERKAFDWFKLAAQQGHSGAQYNVGVYYFKQNQSEEARKWFQLAAENGSEDAISILKRL